MRKIIVSIFLVLTFLCACNLSSIKDYNEAISEKKQDDAMTYVNRGNDYNKLGQYQSAIDAFSEAIRLQPDLTTAYYNRGIAYSNHGQPQLAIEDYNKAIRLQP
jgi:tetratricopeptide (TPR) repeat protein